MSKILIIINDLDIGGIQKSLIDFLIFISGRGLQIDLLLWQKEGLLRKELPDAINVIEMEYAKTWRSAKLEKNLTKKIQFLAEYFKFVFFDKIIKKPWLFFPKIKNSYDTVVCYNQNGYSPFYAIDNVVADKKYLWFHHGSYETTGKKFDLDKKYYAKFNKIITVSLANKIMLSKHFPAYNSKIIVIPNIINVKKVIAASHENVLDFKTDNEVPTFVTVSRFSAEKGIDLAVDIAEELKKQGLKFKWYFVGSGDTFLEIEDMIKEKNLVNECVLLGSKENPYPYMKRGDFYIQTSYVESQSITIYEALALKKIIVTTNLPALNEALKNGKMGVLCEPDKNSFVKEISNLMTDKTAQDLLKSNVECHLISNGIAYEAIDKLFKF